MENNTEIKGLGEVVPCLRCGALCVVPFGPRNPAARILAAAKGPTGVCPSCHITAFLQDPALPFAAILAQRGIHTLRDPRVASQFAAMATVGGADVPAAQIDWERVIEHWALPHPHGTGRRGKEG